MTVVSKSNYNSCLIVFVVSLFQELINVLKGTVQSRALLLGESFVKLNKF